MWGHFWCKFGAELLDYAGCYVLPVAEVGALFRHPRKLKGGSKLG
jgi:hypothetical protein